MEEKSKVVIITKKREKKRKKEHIKLYNVVYPFYYLR
jgi:hypothetical protein